MSNDSDIREVSHIAGPLIRENRKFRAAAKPILDWLADMEANGGRPGGDHELACLRGMWPDSKFFTFGDVRALRDALKQ